MINEVDKDLGGRVRAEDGTWGGLVTEEYLEEVLLVYSCSLVVNVACVVHVCASSGGRMVEELTWEGIVWTVSNVVIGQMNDLVAGDTVLEHNLDSVMCIRLMTIVAVGVRSSHDDSPVVRGVNGGDGDCENSGGSEGFHRKVVVFLSI